MDKNDRDLLIAFTFALICIIGATFFALSQDTMYYHDFYTPIDSPEYSLGFRTEKDIALCNEIFSIEENNNYCLGFMRAE